MIRLNKDAFPPVEIYELSAEVVCMIMNSFHRARDLKVFGATCVKFKQISEDALMWRNLVKKMQGFGYEKREEKLSAKVQFRLALKQKHFAAILAKIYFYCENRFKKINHPKAVLMVDFLSELPDLNTSIQIKGLLKKAELLACTNPNLYERNETALDIVEEILKYDDIPLEEKELASLIKGKLGYYYTVDINDEEVSGLLKNARVAQNISHSSRVEAGLYDCMMAFSGRTSSFSKVKAFEWLGEIIYDNEASIEQRALAALYQVEQICDSKLALISDEKAIGQLNKVLDDLDISDKARMKALFLFASMRYQKRTEAITDDQAFQYLEEVKKNKEADDKDRWRTALIQVKFFSDDRTSFITDEEAFEYLRKLDEEEVIDEDIKYEATLYQAIMQYERKKDFITDEKAMELLFEILEEDQPEGINSKTVLYMALMRYSGRTESISYEKAIEYLELILDDAEAEEKVREKARVILNLMQVAAEL